MRPLAPLAAWLLAAACATTSANRFFDAAVANGAPRPAFGPRDPEALRRESVNGPLPERVLIKTATQSVCRGFQFIVVDGRIQYRRSDAAPGEPWRLLTGTGLPHGSSRDFRAASRIVSIAADADELYAISDEGVVYLLFVERDRKQRPFRWIDRHGWPDVSPLVLNELVAPHRAWSVGTRDTGVLWYEDVAGSAHHYGTMGVATLYFLSPDGREIRFADTGLPSDFSHSLLGPERGAFVAVGLSASASTIFLIGDAGEMYTRLADFDTLGSDPMFFKYTYRKERSDRPGTDYGTNFTPWALPSEPWRRQPPIPLTGEAALSRHVTILQTGRGNGARELRVAGLSPEGRPGYWRKAIFDAEWTFVPAPLEIDPRDLLDRRLVAGGRGSRGPKLEASFSGALWRDGRREPELAFSVPDFAIREGSSTLHVSLGAERVALELHTVDMWTYVKRYDPGFDGTPKLFHATVVIPPGALDGVSAALRDRVRALFGPIDGALFALKAEATERYLLLESPTGLVDLSGPLGLPGLVGTGRRLAGSDRLGLSPRRYLLLTRPGEESADVRVLRNLSAAGSRQLDRYLSDELVLRDPDALTAARRPELEALVARNRRYREDLVTERALFRSYGRSAALSRWGYSVFDVLSTFTLLDRIDFPKFKTLTSHGDDIIRANARAYRFLASTKERTYGKVLDLLDLRISAYDAALEALARGAARATLPPAYRETFAGYLAAAEVPAFLPGTSPAQGGRTAAVYGLPDTPLFPGLVLAVGPEGAGPADAEAIALVLLDDLPRAVASRGDAPLAAVPLRLRGTLQGVLHRGEGASVPLDGDDATIEWDGTTLTIWRHRGLRGKERIFTGRAAGG
ncbi:MAG TPA: hypothetical protein VLT47_05730 [Anaeromyxobacteraceae bacterium]|nr:hypothetical protein [Anaeromyxobacteraceae bacterium]